jgi:pyruvate kinase
LRLLIEELEALRSGMLAAERRRADDIDRVHPSYRRSATNLVHYMELRRHDVRQIQDRLGALGLSTLGRAEAHVLATVEAVLATLHRLAGTTPPSRDDHAVSYEEGERLLRRHTDDLLGPAPQGRWTRIMVTLPTEAADDAGLVRRFRACGMDVARINCAHDDAATWRRMAAHVREAAAQAGRPSRVAMDLAGPKLRTGPLEPGPRVRKFRPRRAVDGSVIEPWRADLATGATQLASRERTTGRSPWTTPRGSHAGHPVSGSRSPTRAVRAGSSSSPVWAPTVCTSKVRRPRTSPPGPSSSRSTVTTRSPWVSCRQSNRRSGSTSATSSA